jgi:hypothetical protein
LETPEGRRVAAPRGCCGIGRALRRDVVERVASPAAGGGAVAVARATTDAASRMGAPSAAGAQ